jgi:hypothetical protein
VAFGDLDVIVGSELALFFFPDEAADFGDEASVGLARQIDFIFRRSSILLV